MDTSAFFSSLHLESFERFSMAIGAPQKLWVLRISSRKSWDKAQTLPPLITLRVYPLGCVHLKVSPWQSVAKWSVFPKSDYWGTLDISAEMYNPGNYSEQSLTCVTLLLDGQSLENKSGYLPSILACFCFSTLASLVAQTVKNPPAMQETWVLALGW